MSTKTVGVRLSASTNALSVALANSERAASQASAWNASLPPHLSWSQERGRAIWVLWKDKDWGWCITSRNELTTWLTPDTLPSWWEMI